MTTRIAFDARPLVGQRTGVSVWLEGLIRGLLAGTDWQVVLCLPAPAVSVGLDDLAGRATVIAPPTRMPGTLWLSTLAAPLVAGRADAFVGTLGILPRRLELPAAVVVHDLTPRTRPRHHTLANRFCFNAYFDASVERADEVVCDSAATLAVLAGALPRYARRAQVVRPGVDPFFSPAPAGEGPADVRDRLTGGRPFIVQLGTLEPRKGAGTLVAAHAELLRENAGIPDLVLAGGQGWGGRWLERELARHPEPERVHLPGYVSRADARALLRHAELVVVASEEEGYGLPLAEALACGSPCLAADAPALVEVAAGAARHFARGSVAALSAALAESLAPAARVVLAAAARARAPALTWEEPLAAWRTLLAILAGERGAAGSLSPE